MERDRDTYETDFGYTKEDVEEDQEGLMVARQLGYNMAYLIKAISLYKETNGLPKSVERKRTNFIK